MKLLNFKVWEALLSLFWLFTQICSNAEESFMFSTEVAIQWEAKSCILYFDTAESHIKLMGTHNHYPHPFLLRRNIFLYSSEVDMYKKPIH